QPPHAKLTVEDPLMQESSLRTYVVELFGTFFVVFLGAASVCVSMPGGEMQPWSLLTIGLATGAAYAGALAISLRYPDNGALNPAITLMLWVFKRLDTSRLFSLIGVQLVGAGLAGLCLRLFFGLNELTAR